MPSATKRDGRAVEELGFYNPHTNEANINVLRVKARLAQGAQPTANSAKFITKGFSSLQIKQVIFFGEENCLNLH